MYLTVADEENTPLPLKSTCFFFSLIFIYLEFFFFFFFAVLGLCCFMGVSLVALQGFLIALASLVAEHRF